MSENTEETSDGFWDAILEIAGNDYIDTPSPKEFESMSTPTSFTFDMYSGDGPSVSNTFRRGPQDLYTPTVQYSSSTVTTVKTPILHTPVPNSLVDEKQLEIAFLKEMLQNSINPTYPSNPSTPSEPCLEEDDDEEEDDIKMVERFILDSNLLDLDVKMEEPVEEHPYLTIDRSEIDNVAEEVTLSSQIEPKVEDELPEDCRLLDNHNLNSIISDDRLTSLSVRELNNVLRGVPKNIRLQLKQRKRLLKNRSYARNARNKRLDSEKAYQEENGRLKKRLELMTAERNLYKAKYENLKDAILKAKREREHRKRVELDVRFDNNSHYVRL